MDPIKILIVKNWPVLKNVSEVRSFLKLHSYYQKFMLDFFKIAGLLTKFLRKAE